MQLCLSNLVDLALSKPHYLECESFDILHILLHIVLKKLNLSDTKVKLYDELEAKAQSMMKALPADLSICFNEYIIKDDGGKIRKRTTRELCSKKSLTIIRKKWPHCCPSVRCCPSKASSIDKCSSEVPSSIESKLMSKTENPFERLSQRVYSLENELTELNYQYEEQTKQNLSVVDELMKIKQQFEKVSPVIDLMHKGSIVSLPELLPKNCELKIEIRGKESSDCSETVTSDDDEGSQYVGNVTEEIKWIKDQMLELSESQKAHSQCLKRLKCDDYPKLKQNSDEITQCIQSLKCQIIENNDTLNLIKCKYIEDIKSEVDRLKSQAICFNCQLHKIEDTLKTENEETYKRIDNIRVDLEEKINEKMRSRSSTYCTSSSEILNVQDLQKKTETNFDAQEYTNDSFSRHGCFDKEQITSGTSAQPFCATSQNSPSTPQYYTETPQIPCNSDYSCSPTTDCHCRSECSTSSNCLCDIQRQISSHNYCLQQLIRDIACKSDRCEFDMCRRQLSETIDVVMKMQRDQKRAISNPPMAAGTSVPLLRNFNCISCHATTNMTLTACAVPKLESLKYGRVRNNPTMIDCDRGDTSRETSDQNRNIYNQKIRRRVGGSHTKFTKVMEVNRMRFKRLKTPVLNRMPSFMIYRNRLKRNARCY